MGPLRNQRHERFCLALAEGHSISESFTLAGYSKNTGNACRLNANESVRERVAELQAQAAVDSKVTVESICRELDEANAVAKAKGQAAAMVSAATLRAKLAGLMVERVEVGNPGEFDGLNSTAEIVDEVLAQLVEQFRPVDQKDREGLLAMYQRHLAEADEYIRALQARPLIAERVDARNLDKPWTEHRPYSPATRIGYRGNGSKSA